MLEHHPEARAQLCYYRAFEAKQKGEVVKSSFLFEKGAKILDDRYTPDQAREIANRAVLRARKEFF